MFSLNCITLNSITVTVCVCVSVCLHYLLLLDDQIGHRMVSFRTWPVVVSMNTHTCRVEENQNLILNWNKQNKAEKSYWNRQAKFSGDFMVCWSGDDKSCNGNWRRKSEIRVGQLGHKWKLWNKRTTFGQRATVAVGVFCNVKVRVSKSNFPWIEIIDSSARYYSRHWWRLWLVLLAFLEGPFLTLNTSLHLVSIQPCVDLSSIYWNGDTTNTTNKYIYTFIQPTGNNKSISEVLRKANSADHLSLIIVIIRSITIYSLISTAAFIHTWLHL